VRFGTLSQRLVLVREHAVLDVNQASEGRFPADAKCALERWEELRAWAGQADWSAARPLADAALGPPVPLPRQVFAVALNYRPHAAEAGFSPPSEPLIFTKFPSCVTGPYGTIALPDGHVDWEIELVAVVGTGGRDIARAKAWGAIAGVTIGQDLSERKLQLTGTPPQFSLAKSFAGFGPTGPVAVTTDELADRDDIGFECWLNNERVQRGRTSEMIFPVDDLVARLSRVCRLLPGDLIFTGTPAGVGNRRNPPRYLAEGDVLVSRFEGIGEIRQSFAR
jgi:2-keto-4-pentenoate hydratase/2-oxohepta-3-ene-1,7-dioic acid hydratase in catechol pathway